MVHSTTSWVLYAVSSNVDGRPPLLPQRRRPVISLALFGIVDPQIGQHRRERDRVMPLTGGDDQRHRPAPGVGRDVDLRAQPTPGTTNAPANPGGLPTGIGWESSRNRDATLPNELLGGLDPPTSRSGRITVPCRAGILPKPRCHPAPSRLRQPGRMRRSAESSCTARLDVIALG
jgi:hypothetical protein